MLLNYSYPGNVRELENILERAANYADNGKIEAENILIFREEIAPNVGGSSIITYSQRFQDTKDQAERKVIIDALKKCKGSKTEAAKLLQISRSLLYLKLKQLKINTE